MKEYSKYCISKDANLREALAKLNELSADTQTLIVVDSERRLVGTITDGDVRRGLVAGKQQTDSVTTIINSNCKYVFEGEDNVALLKQMRMASIKLVPVVSTTKQMVDIINLHQYQSILPIDAVIMAGGKGERLRPLTLTTPKPLLQVGNKTIIDYNVDRLIAYGIRNISITVNYLAEQLVEHYREPRQDVQIQCVREQKFLGTMGAVRLVKEFYNDVVLVMNSDLFTDIDFEDMYLHFMENKADMSIAVVPYTVSIPFGICDLDGRDVKGIVEKPTYNYYANAGIYMLRRDVLDRIPQDEFFNATDMIDALVQSHNKVIRYPLKGTWIDIGSISEYQKANDLAKHMN